MSVGVSPHGSLDFHSQGQMSAPPGFAGIRRDSPGFAGIFLREFLGKFWGIFLGDPFLLFPPLWLNFLEDS